MRIGEKHFPIYGIDIGKTLFHVSGCDRTGKPVFRIKLRRDALLTFFAKAKLATIGMEACPSSQWLARKLIELGHDARIMPAQFVKPYLKANKNDMNDAEAIAEAVQRPTMRFVAARRTDQVDTQALHRVRTRLVQNRTQLIAQTRSLCLEYGIAIRVGVSTFKLDIPWILENAENELTPVMRQLVADLWTELSEIEIRLKAVSRQIEAIADSDESARRLMTIPGFGALTATALLSAVGDPTRFRRGRDLSAWIGLVPRQYSTGGKNTLLGISKRGNPYLRKLLIHGARTCKLHLNRDRDRLGPWLNGAEQRLHSNKVCVALANKLARIAWVIMTTPGATYDKGVPMAV